MAVTSLWRVNGWLGKVVIYVENPDKTENPDFYEKPGMSDAQMQGLSDVIAYAVRQEKAKLEDGVSLQNFVSGVNCLPATAREEMLAVKKRFGKEDGTVAYHGYQSFAPGEATPEIAHEIAVRLARQLWGEKYQVLIATHLDKENHLHSHFVINTVSFVDGIKFHRTEKDYYDMRRASDELCREYGLSVIEKPKPGKSRHYGEWRAEQEQRPTWRGLVRSDVDEAIRQSMTERQFYDALKQKGYEIKVGKDISVRPPGKERFVRLSRNFGERYSPEGIREQILRQDRPARKDTDRGKASYPPKPKAKGFRALYYHYCYLLGVFPGNKPRDENKRLHFLLREDLIKMEAISEEARLLARHQIDTAGQLSSYKESVMARIEAVTGERKTLYKKQRTVAVKSDEVALSQVREQIAALTAELKGLRKEVRLCDDIAVRSGVMSEKLNTIEAEEQAKGKETKRDERVAFSSRVAASSWASTSSASWLRSDRRLVQVLCPVRRTRPAARWRPASRVIQSRSGATELSGSRPSWGPASGTTKKGDSASPSPSRRVTRSRRTSGRIRAGTRLSTTPMGVRRPAASSRDAQGVWSP